MSAVYSYAENDPSSDREVAQLRVPPHSIESESSVLGGLLLPTGKELFDVAAHARV